MPTTPQIDEIALMLRDKQRDTLAQAETMVNPNSIEEASLVRRKIESALPNHWSPVTTPVGPANAGSGVHTIPTLGSGSAAPAASNEQPLTPPVTSPVTSEPETPPVQQFAKPDFDPSTPAVQQIRQLACENWWYDRHTYAKPWFCDQHVPINRGGG